jgi:hypothetical protein
MQPYFMTKLFFGLGLLVFAVAFYLWQDEQQLIADATMITDGEVLSKVIRENYPTDGYFEDRYYVTYGFYDLRDNYYEREARVTRSVYDEAMQGEPIALRFVPAEPSRSRLVEGERHGLLEAVAFMGFGFWVVAILFFVIEYRPNRKARQIQ